MITCFYNKVLKEDSPLLSAILPSHHRIQIVIPPACEVGKVVMAIRKPVVAQMTLEALQELRLFDEAIPCFLRHLNQNIYPKEEDSCLLKLFTE